MSQGRSRNPDEFEQFCDRVGAEAQARGLTEEILNQILNEIPTDEEAARSCVSAKDLLASIAVPRNRSSR